MPDSVVEHEPTSRGLYGWRRKANLVGIPPGAAPRFQHEPVPAPMPEIGRVGNPHVRSERRHGAVNERPVSVDSAGQKGAIFVVRWHDDAVALESSKVFGQGQRYSRTAARIGGVGDNILLRSEE